MSLHQSGDIRQAYELYRSIQRRNPDDPEVLHLAGLALHQLGDAEQAIDLIRRAIELKPNTALFARNLGQVHLHLDQHQQALDAYLMALQAKPDDLASWHGRIRALLAMKRWEEGLTCIEALQSLYPQDPIAQYLHGQALEGVGNTIAAAKAYRRSLELAPNNAHALNSLGILQLALHEYDAAVQSLSRAIEIDPKMQAAYNNRGVVYQQCNRLDLAMADFRQVKALRPDQPLIHGKLIDIRLKQCDWVGLDADVSEIAELVAQGRNCISPFRLLSISDSLTLNRQCAEQYAKAMWPAAGQKHQIPQPPPSHRIRLGYFSADMHNHARLSGRRNV